ncbi:MAG: ATP-binding protein [Lachnospiraceae bacterium]|nr:ATP-binding protein [Lachnospiraceae bacterium]
MNNPYNLIFGKEPFQVIPRNTQKNEIIDAFLSEPSVQQIYMITGIRGCGKTVFMTEVSKEIGKEKDWIVVELNSQQDLMTDLAATLGSENNLAKMFKSASINLSLFGIGLEVKDSVPVSSIQVALEKMLESLKKHKKKVLICIDEVTVTTHMKTFAGAFQIFVRKDLPIYLLMTGLYENINILQNEKSLTFLYRAPKIELKPLNIGSIMENYKENFNLKPDEAGKMAALTKGYSFAFQVLGYFTFRQGGDYKKAIPEFRQYLEDYVYEKVFSEMSAGDRKFVYSLACTENGKAKDIKTKGSFSDSEYSVYRDRLIKRGVINGSEHGFVRFTLPLFDEYVIRCVDFTPITK